MPSASEAFDQASMHEHVVDRGDRDGVDALGLDLVRLLHVAGQVVAVAGRREGAGDGDEHDLAALEDIVRGLGHGPVRRHDAEGGLGQAVANLDWHRQFSEQCEKVRLLPSAAGPRPVEAHFRLDGLSPLQPASGAGERARRILRASPPR